MKYIFDFDDTLFDAKKFKELIFSSLADIGIEKEEARSLYSMQGQSGAPFNLMDFLWSVSREKFDEKVLGALYEKIMAACPQFVNQEILESIRRIGRENCYIVTKGDNRFQLEKIERTELPGLCRDVYITPNSKKAYIEEICQRHKDEEVLYVEDKTEFFDNLDGEKTANLTKLHFNKEIVKEIREKIGKEAGFGKLK